VNSLERSWGYTEISHSFKYWSLESSLQLFHQAFLDILILYVEFIYLLFVPSLVDSYVRICLSRVRGWSYF
jgi:hypothetical protein